MAPNLTSTVIVLLRALLAILTSSSICAEVKTEDHRNKAFVGRVVDGKSLYHANDKHWYLRAMEQTKLRVKNLQTSKHTNSSSPIISLGPMTTQFYIVLEVGTPPQQALMSIDTGSDLAWLQCEPCNVCFNQSSAYAPQIFDPSLSSSYVSTGCSIPVCAAGESVGATFSCNKEDCLYNVQYMDSSYTRGVLSTESVSLKQFDDSGDVNDLNVQGWMFGCGHTNQGRFGGGASGILGLNEGELSFQNQLAAHHTSFSNSFGYCFPNRFDEESSGMGFIFFGDITQLVDIQLFVTTMVRNPVEPYFYYIDMVGITVGDELLNIDSSAWQIQSDGSGGTRLDTGTTAFLASTWVYEKVLEALEAGTPIEMERDGNAYDTTGFELCFKVPHEANMSVPKLILHFRGLHVGQIVDWELPSRNYFIPMDSEKRLFCYSIFTLPGISFSILGNTVVQDHLIGIHQDKREYAISSITDCSRPPIFK